MRPTTALIEAPASRNHPPNRRSADLRVDLSAPLVDAGIVAAMLCVKRKRVYELARRPNDPLPSVRIGGAVRFVRAQVEAWVAGQAAR